MWHSQVVTCPDSSSPSVTLWRSRTVGHLTGSGGRLPEFTFWLLYWQALWPWANSPIVLSLCFHNCRIEIIPESGKRLGQFIKLQWCQQCNIFGEILSKHRQSVALFKVPFMKLYKDSNWHLVNFLRFPSIKISREYFANQLEEVYRRSTTLYSPCEHAVLITRLHASLLLDSQLLWGEAHLYLIFIYAEDKSWAWYSLSTHQMGAELTAEERLRGCTHPSRLPLSARSPPDS